MNQTELGRDVRLSQPTVHRWLKLLEASYQLVRVPAYAVNRTKRLIKTPKLYWADTGLAMHLAGENEPRGPHLENLILGDLLAWRNDQLRTQIADSGYTRFLKNHTFEHRFQQIFAPFAVHKGRDLLRS